jgi:hypothetical protein
VLRCDNRPELACVAMADWARERVGPHVIPAGEPWRNGYVESFNSRSHDERLNINISWSLAHARVHAAALRPPMIVSDPPLGQLTPFGRSSRGRNR